MGCPWQPAVLPIVDNKEAGHIDEDGMPSFNEEWCEDVATRTAEDVMKQFRLFRGRGRR